MSLNKHIPESILVRIKATHFNFVNKNSLLYTENAVDRGAKTWTVPFRKPQLVSHDTKSDPIGRVIGYKIIKGDSAPKSGAPKDYIELTVKISDSAAIEKVLDGRYETVSVGSRSHRVICSECDQIITDEGLCEHKKGSYNEDGNLIYWIIDQIEYTEDSFVNEPADEFAAIDQIQISGEWVNYSSFLDNRETIISQMKMEDSMPINTDAKLSTEQRNKLPDSAFCGPNKSFPAHDKAHVTAGLRLLGRAKASDETKAKIRACLLRKGKKYGITPQKDEIGEDFDILFRMEDEFTQEEINELNDWFKENPDSDLPEVESADTNDKAGEQQDQKEDNQVDISKLKKDEAISHAQKLQKELEDARDESKKAIDLRDKKIADLENKVQQAETLTYEKENELNKYIDQVCVLEQKYRKSVISNIIDLKVTDNNKEETETSIKALNGRTLESLEDSLNDLRDAKIEKAIESNGKVIDPTLDNTDENRSDSQKNEDDFDTEGQGDPRFAIFSVDRRNVEGDD